MAIQIQNRKLTPDQYLKLYSNPVSGIACDMNGAGTNYDYAHFGRFHLKNIRYSKSMMLKALYFWEKQYDRYLELLKKAQFNPLFSSKNNKENEVLKMIMFVHNLPDTFLFSHRHIHDIWDGVKPGNHYPRPIMEQIKLLNDKYPILFNECYSSGFQEQTTNRYYRIKTEIGIEFTVFPCEHPYIEKQKISKVGITDNGNVYILHDRERKNKK
jgi:hypothetical protein